MTGSLFKFAWRNLWRRKRRTLITASSIALGLFLSVTFTGFGDHTYTKMIDMSALMGYGHVTVLPKGYNDRPASDLRLADAESILNRVNGVPGVTDASPKILSPAVFAIGGKSGAGFFIAIDPARESRKNNLFIRSLVGGALFEGTRGREVLVGNKLAERLRLKIGKKFVYTTTDVHGEIVSEAAVVAGIFRTGAEGVDSTTVLLPIDTARATLRYGKKEATLISILIEDQRDAEEMKLEIAKKLGFSSPNGTGTLGVAAATVASWSETQADLAGFVAVDRSGNRLLQFLIGIMIAAGILNTIMMSVLERRHEFGVMMAVGTSPIELFYLVMAESFLLWVIGILFGSVLTTPWFFYMSEWGLDMSRFLEEGMDIGGVSFLVDPALKFRLFKESVFVIVSSLFLLTMSAGLYPAVKAGRMRPVEAIRLYV